MGDGPFSLPASILQAAAGNLPCQFPTVFCLSGFWVEKPVSQKRVAVSAASVARPFFTGAGSAAGRYLFKTTTTKSYNRKNRASRKSLCCKAFREIGSIPSIRFQRTKYSFSAQEVFVFSALWYSFSAHLWINQEGQFRETKAISFRLSENSTLDVMYSFSAH